MSDIIVLKPSIYTAIAAGEVVDGPYSIVKELVENSVDAKATDIRVDVFNGGFDLIRVIDNGFGIKKEDIAKVFMLHATSKIKTIEELSHISTMGFRGEALPSIAACSDVELLSRRADDLTANHITYSFGEKISHGESGGDVGTTVTIRNLFSKMPARKKFLGSARQETNKITRLIRKLILANYNIAFSYYIDGELKLQSDGSGKDAAIYAIFKGESEEFLQISDSGIGVQLSGFIGNLGLTKQNKVSQIIIVNGRAIENDDISFSAFLAYKDYLPHKRQPVFVLYIDVPFDFVDVNVHPNKTRIKFLNVEAVRKIVYAAIKRVLENMLYSTTALQSSETPPELSPQDAIVGYAADDFPSSENVWHNSINVTHNATLFSEAVAEPSLAIAAKGLSEIRQSIANLVFEMPKESGVEVITKLFNTYLLVKVGDEHYLIDQHAAHERILFDSLSDRIDKQDDSAQPLLVPYEFNFGEESSLTLCETLAELGFELECDGEICRILAVPSELCAINLSDFISAARNFVPEIAKKSDFLRDKIASLACRAAVKGGDELSERQITNLLDLIVEAGTIPLCPHGRPTIVKLSEVILEHLFKRR